MASTVSIIVPCFNQGNFLKEALLSVFDQTYESWECIIVNDGSTDSTKIIAEEWCIKDSRFYLISQPNSGLSSARNRGMEKAMGDFLLFLDADDLLHKKKLELSLKSITEDKNATDHVIISNFKILKEKEKLIVEPFCNLHDGLFNFNSVLYEWESEFTIPIHCGLIKTSLLRKFQFPEHLNAKEDWIMWLFLFQKDTKIIFLDEPLVYYRMHNENMTLDIKFMGENKVRAILYLKNIISNQVLISYYSYIIENKYKEVFKLRNTLRNYRNSRTFRYLQKLKKLFK